MKLSLKLNLYWFKNWVWNWFMSVSIFQTEFYENSVWNWDISLVFSNFWHP